MQAHNSGDLKDTGVVSVAVYGTKVEQEVNKKFFNADKSPNDDIYTVVSKIHKDILGIQSILQEDNLKNFSNQCFATDISAMMDVRERNKERLPRLYELLEFIKDGTFSFGCTLVECKYHSENEGGCPCGENLTELMKIAPDLIGCATGRALLGMDRRKYHGSSLEVPTEKVTVVRRKMVKKRK